MDYVIAGLAAGACLAIAGFLLREAGLSRRMSLPLWFADAGLAMMSAAVVTWLLTFTAITTEQNDDSAAAIIVAGTAVSLVAAVVLVVHSGSRRRAILMRTREPVRQAAQVFEAESPGEPQPSPGPASATAPKEEPAAARSIAAWEESWRETWGGHDGAPTRQTTEAPVSETESVVESQPAWESWSSEEDATEPRSDEYVASNAPTESNPITEAKPAAGANGALQVLEPAKESDS